KNSSAYSFIGSTATVANIQSAINTVGKGEYVNTTNLTTIQNSLADYINRIVNNNNTEVVVLVDGNYNETTVRNTVNAKVAEMKAGKATDADIDNSEDEPTIFIERATVKGLTTAFKHSDVNFTAKYRYIIVLANNLTTAQQTQLKAAALINNAHVVGITNDVNKTNQIIADAMKKGTSIKYSNLTNNLNSAFDYVVASTVSSFGKEELYLLKDSKFDLTTTYRDYEND